MRALVLASALFGLSATCQAQTQGDLEARYVAACQKEDTEAFCRCEFKAMTELVNDIRDLEFLTQLEERTSGLPDEESDKVMRSLPPDRLQWVIGLAPRMSAAQEKCPDFRKR
jgi:hypothetical protein